MSATTPTATTNQPAYAKVLALTELELELGTSALKKPMSQPITADG